MGSRHRYSRYLNTLEPAELEREFGHALGACTVAGEPVDLGWPSMRVEWTHRMWQLREAIHRRDPPALVLRHMAEVERVGHARSWREFACMWAIDDMYQTGETTRLDVALAELDDVRQHRVNQPVARSGADP